jgi:hypothetical protein
MNPKTIASILLISILSACSPIGNTVENTEIVAPVSTPTSNLIFTEIPESTATNIPVSLFSTKPISTLTFEKWTVEQVIESFRKAHLEAALDQKMTEKDYDGAPMLASDGLRFYIAGCSDCGGRILAFSDQSSLDKTKKYYTDLGSDTDRLFENNNILVIISGDIRESTVNLYGDALNNMK